MNRLKIVSIFVVLTFVCNSAFGIKINYVNQTTIDELKQTYPHVTFKVIGYDEYLTIRNSSEVYRAEHSNQLLSTVLVTAALTNQVADTEPKDTANDKDVSADTEKRSHSSGPSILSGYSSGDSGGGDGALVLIVLIGLVVAAFLVVAGTKILYEAAINEYDFPRLLDVSTTVSVFEVYENKSENDEKPESELVEEGLLAGVKLTFGLIDDRNAGKRNNRATAIALTTEMGFINGHLRLDNEKSNGQKTIDLTGNYILVGPSVRYMFKTEAGYSNYIGAELLAGTTDHEEVGVLSIGRILLSGGSRNMHGGFHLGAMYVELKPEEGVFREGSDFCFIYGIDFGYLF